MPEELTCEALRRARAVQQPVASLVVYSDQGSHYVATRFKALLVRHQAVQRTSRRGNCYDDAHAESCWSPGSKLNCLTVAAFLAWPKPILEINHYIACYNVQ